MPEARAGQSSGCELTQSLAKRAALQGPRNTSCGASPTTHLITVGVISAQKNTLRLPTAWEANMPTMENAMENLSLTLSLIPEGQSERVGEEGQREGERRLVRLRRREQGRGEQGGLGRRKGLPSSPLCCWGAGQGAQSLCRGRSSPAAGGQTLWAVDCRVPAGPLWVLRAGAHSDCRVPQAEPAWPEGRLAVSGL